MSCSPAHPLVALALLIVPLHAGTIVVDDDGGPGVDFVDIPRAIDAALPGDLILVLEGTYSGFVVDRSLTILGEDGAAAGPSRIEGGLFTGSVVLAELGIETLEVTDCASVVTLVGLTLRSLTVSGCTDVRLHRSTVQDGTPSVAVTASRLEVVQSSVTGHAGAYFGCGEYGGSGLVAIDSPVHVGLSSIRGGDGGHAWDFCGADRRGGNGGNGLEAHGVSTLLISGLPTDRIAGGPAGCSATGESNYQAPGGAGLVLLDSSSLRISNVVLEGGPWCFMDFVAPDFYTNSDQPPERALPPDPTLETIGPDPLPGQTVQLRLHAPVGTQARLILGRRAVVAPISGVIEDLLASRDRTIDLGVVPPTEALDVLLPVPTSAPTGTTFYLQAVVDHDGRDVRLTHSVPVVVR